MRKSLMFATMLAVMLSLVVFVAPAYAASCSGSELDTSNHTVVTIDSKVGGGYWAEVTLQRIARYFSDNCVEVTDTGTFVTFGGVSPSNNSTVASGVTGTVTGGFVVTMSGESGFQSGDLGLYDYDCDQNGVCSAYVHWSNIFFTTPGGYSFQEWGWVYDPTCPSNGHWENSSSGNSGDITGDPDLTCIVVSGPSGSSGGYNIAASGSAKATKISSDSLWIGSGNAFEVTFHGQSCTLKLWGGDLSAPVYAQMVPGSAWANGNQTTASFVLSDLLTGNTLVDFQGKDALHNVKVACVGPAGSTANGSELVVSIFR